MVFTIPVKSWTLLINSVVSLEGENGDQTCWTRITTKVQKADHKHKPILFKSELSKRNTLPAIHDLNSGIWCMRPFKNTASIKKVMRYFCFVINKAVANCYSLVAFLRWAIRSALSDDFLNPIFVLGMYLGILQITPPVSHLPRWSLCSCWHLCKKMQGLTCLSPEQIMEIWPSHVLTSLFHGTALGTLLNKNFLALFNVTHC